MVINREKKPFNRNSTHKGQHIAPRIFRTFKKTDEIHEQNIQLFTKHQIDVAMLFANNLSEIIRLTSFM